LYAGSVASHMRPVVIFMVSTSQRTVSWLGSVAHVITTTQGTGL